jgi:hypothetical protein
MTERHALTVVINVFDDKYCDVYFFTPEQKKWCANLMFKKTFISFVIDSMHYPLFNTKHDNPEKDLKSLVRTYLNANFGRVRDMSIYSYLDFPQSYSLGPAFDIKDSAMDEVYVCDYCIGNLYGCSDTSSWFYRVPKLYRANEFVCDDDCTFHLQQEELDDVISTVKRCGDELATFEELSLYAVKDDRDIEVCPFSVGNKDYFVQKAIEHANDENYLKHKTYVYEYKNGKTNKTYGCCRFNEASNVVALNLEKEDNQDKDSIANFKTTVVSKTTLNVTTKNIYALHLNTMIATINREILHIDEDVDSLFSFIEDGEYTSEDLESVQFLSKSIKDLSVLVKRWKGSAISRVLEDRHFQNN